MPSGRFFPFDLGIYTLRILFGFEFTSIALSKRIEVFNARLLSPLGIAIPSTPAVFLPLLYLVMRYTARTFTAKERFVRRSKMCRIRFTLLVATALSNLCCIENTYRSQALRFSALNRCSALVLRVFTILVLSAFIQVESV